MEQHESSQPDSRPSKRRRLLFGIFGASTLVVSAAAVTGALQGDTDHGVLTDAERSAIAGGLMDSLATASPGQQAAAADGEIEVTEMMQLGQDASDCATARGAPPIEMRWNRNRLDRSQLFDPDLPMPELERLLAISDECWEEHLGIVEMLKSIDVVPPVAEQRSYNLAVQECLTSQDQPGDGWPATDAKIDPQIEALCVEEVETGR